MKQLIAGIVIAAAVIGGVFTVSHVKFIGTGKVGIVYNYKDGVQDTVLPPGAHFIAPMNKLKEFSTSNEMRFLFLRKIKEKVVKKMILSKWQHLMMLVSQFHFR